MLTPEVTEKLESINNEMKYCENEIYNILADMQTSDIIEKTGYSENKDIDESVRKINEIKLEYYAKIIPELSKLISLYISFTNLEN